MRSELQAAIRAAHEAGNAAQEVTLRGRLALWEGQNGRWARAARQFDLAAQLAIQHEQVGVAAQLRYSQGLALQQIPKPKAAANVLQEAAELAARAEQPLGQRRAHQTLAEIALGEGDLPKATAETTAALAHSESIAQEIELLRGRANLYWLSENHTAARADLQRAVELAREVGDEGVVVAVEWELDRVGAGAQGSRGAGERDRLGEMLGRAMGAGVWGVSSDIALEQAVTFYGVGEWGKAEEAAELARQQALASTDMVRYVRYLCACLVRAMALEQVGKDAAVLDTLLTCKNTLQRHLGDEIGVAMKELLDSLLPRWGEERFRVALATYRMGK